MIEHRNNLKSELGKIKMNGRLSILEDIPMVIKDFYGIERLVLETWDRVKLKSGGCFKPVISIYILWRRSSSPRWIRVQLVHFLNMPSVSCKAAHKIQTRANLFQSSVFSKNLDRCLMILQISAVKEDDYK